MGSKISLQKINLQKLEMHCIYCNRTPVVDSVCDYCKMDCVKCRNATCAVMVYNTVAVLTDGFCFECYLFPVKCTMCHVSISSLAYSRGNGVCQSCVSLMIKCLLCDTLIPIEEEICKKCMELKSNCPKCQTPYKNKTLLKYDGNCRTCYTILQSDYIKGTCVECKTEEPQAFMHGCRTRKPDELMCFICWTLHKASCAECPKDYTCVKCHKILRVAGRKKHNEHCKSTSSKTSPKTSPKSAPKSATPGVRKSIPAQIRFECWTRENGKSLEGKCWCCDAALRFIEFEAGHLVSVALGGQNLLDNLRPVCRTCNNNCRTKNMIDYKKELKAFRAA